MIIPQQPAQPQKPVKEADAAIRLAKLLGTRPQITGALILNTIGINALLVVIVRTSQHTPPERPPPNNRPRPVPNAIMFWFPS
jgi:hypothetical protein